MLKETDLHEYQKKAVEHIITHNYCGLFLGRRCTELGEFATSYNF